MAQKQNTSPPSGTRDFLPEDVRKREHVLQTVRTVYQRYGFEPLETPAMERLDTLLGKYGEEGDKLIFRILHRGEKLDEVLKKGGAQPADLSDMALRYDLTVPLARVVAEHQSELPRFFKRYQIQPVWRADRPGRGRFREFYQCDVDAVGSESLTCDAEVVNAICEVLDGLKFTDYRVRLNHRGLLTGILEASGIPKEKEVDAITTLDKLDKIGAEGVLKELADRGVADESAKRLLEIAALPAKHPADNAALLSALGAVLSASEAGKSAIAQLTRLLELGAQGASGRRLAVDPSLARGLSYYTGPIFEVQVADLAGSLGGGGRYDNLIGMFLGRKVPAVGFSLGLERILVVMEERKMFPNLSASAPVMVFQLEEATVAEAMAVASEIRKGGTAVELYPNVDKLGKQFQYAESRGAKLALFVGSRERDAGEVAMKILSTQQQSSVKRTELVQSVEWALASVETTRT